MPKIFTLLFLSLFFISQAPAQSGNYRPDYKLLWKIEGKGLKKPSYLFGTMHVRDKRAFDFSDSVLLKITQCDGFALEVHPDSIVKAVFKSLFDYKQKNKFKEILNEKEYAELDSLAKEKSGYSLDKLKSPQLARIMLDKSLDKKNKNAFLDAYLYSVARNSGKKILGLEKVEDQLNLFTPTTPAGVRSMLLEQLQTTSASAANSFEELVVLYHKGNIDEMHSYLKKSVNSGGEYYKKMFTDRNLVMAESIGKEIHNQSTFIAIGAGHLPGDDGVIKLLQKAGYRVTAMRPAFTGLAKKFKITKTEADWETFKNESGGFSIQMPGTPFNYKIDSIGMNFNVWMDISGPSFYQYTYLPMDAELKGKPASVIADKVEARLRTRQKGKMDRIKRIQISGLEAIEFTQTNRGEIFRIQFVLRDPFIYMMQVGPNKEAVNSPDAERFFSSIRMENFKKENWKEFSDEQGAFKVQLCSTPSKKINTVNYSSFPVDIHIYYSENISQKETYMIRYNDMPAGFVSMNDSTYYSNFATDLLNRMMGKNLKLFDANIDGFAGKEFTYEITDEDIIKGREVLRGNRLYLILANTKKNNATSEVNTVFSSFHFADYLPAKLKEYTINDQLKINLPSAPRYDSASSRGASKMYKSVDPSSGMQLIIRTSELGPYDYYKNEDAYFEKHYTIEKTDSVIFKNKLKNNDFFGEEVTFKSSIVNALIKMVTIVQGRNVVELNAYVPVDYEKSNLVDDFLKSFKITPSDSKWNLFTPKTDQFLADLASTDTLVHKPAESKLYSYEFAAEDLPKLYSAIEKNYPDDKEEYGSIKRQLILKLKDVKDSTTVLFLKNIYPSLPQKSGVRSAVFHVLNSIQTDAATQTYFELLKGEDSVKLNTYFVLSSYADSLRLLEPVVPQLFANQNRFDSKGYLYSLTAKLLDKPWMSDAAKEKINHLLVEEAKKELAAPLILDVKHDDYYSTSYLYQSIASALTELAPQKEVIELVKAVNRTGYPYAQLKALPYLAKQNVAIATGDLEKLASNSLYNVQLYTALKEVNQEKLFPKGYLSQEKFAAGMITAYMENEDGAPEALELVGTKAVEIKGEKQKLFVYKYRIVGGTEWYIAISGPFKGKEFTSEQGFTYNTYTPYSKATLDADIEEILKETDAKLVK